MNKKDRDALEEALKIGIQATETQRRSFQAYVENLIQSALGERTEQCARIAGSLKLPESLQGPGVAVEADKFGCLIAEAIRALNQPENKS